jgi:hypothetical protein
VVLATFLVTNTMDNLPGQPLIDGTLRQAIALSDATAGPNEIDFAAGLSGTIVLTGGQLTIANNDLTIVGPGADELSVSGNNASRVFEVDGVRAALSGLTITGGRSVSFFLPGGGLYNSGGTVTIDDCSITGNSAFFSGGIDNSGMLTIDDCSITGNSAGDGAGGGLNNNGGTVTIDASAIAGNSGFGLGDGLANNGGGKMTIDACTIAGNFASFLGHGGGLANNDSTMTLDACSLTGNSGYRPDCCGNIL